MFAPFQPTLRRTPVVLGDHPSKNFTTSDNMRYYPDLAIQTIDANFEWSNRTSLTRVVGDVKPSWKWSTDLKDSPKYEKQDTLAWRRQYKQVFAQVYLYMNLHQVRYGFIITDKQMVAIKKTPAFGIIKVSNPILWEERACGPGPANERFTVLLAIWYLGMLASNDQSPNDQGWMMGQPGKK